MGNRNGGSALPAHSSLPPLRGSLPSLPFLTSSPPPEWPAQVTHGLRQWAAVSSQRSLMRVAPQKSRVRKKSPTCQGCELGRHSLPPMARVSAQLCPGVGVRGRRVGEEPGWAGWGQMLGCLEGRSGRLGDKEHGRGAPGGQGGAA